MPVAFFIYNRPDVTDVVFQRIAAARPERLFIARRSMFRTLWVCPNLLGPLASRPELLVGAA